MITPKRAASAKPVLKIGQDECYYFNRSSTKDFKEQKIYNENFTFENDLTITFPFQPNQTSPIKIDQLLIRKNEWIFKFNDLFDILKLDSTGILYKKISQIIYNDPKANEVYYETPKSKLNNDDDVHLIMIDKDGSINIDYISKNLSYNFDFFSIGKIKLSSNNSNFKYSQFSVEKNDSEKVLNKFINRYITGSGDSEGVYNLTNYDKVKFEIGKYSSFDGPKGANSIPTYKQICFSTLKELYSVGDKIETIKKIKSLPFDLQFQFIQYCSQFEKPIGCDIVLHLYKDLNDDDELKTKLFPLQTLVTACLNRDTWYRSNFLDLYKPIVPKPDILINVFENIQLFKFKELNEKTNRHLLFKSSNQQVVDKENGEKLMVDGSLSIVSKEEFLNNFHNATNGIFKNKLNKGFIFYGGLITSCLTGLVNGFEHSDIDILMLANEETGVLHESEYIDAVTDLLGDDYESDGYSAYAMGGHITFTKQYPYRPIQFNVYTYKNLQDVLLGVDIDCSCFAFDGENVWTLERGILSMNHRINIASEFSYRVRGDSQYQRRLLKYLDRGFSIFYQDSPAIEKILQNFQKSTASEFMIGFELLLAAKHSEDVLNCLKKSTKDRSFPYGPEWKKENFDRYMKMCFENIYDGYSSSGVYCPVEGIDDIFGYLESPTESYQTNVVWDIPNFSEQYAILKSNQEEENERFDEIPPLEEFLNLKNQDDPLPNQTSKFLKSE